jgi:hypothetical protein
LTTTANRLKRQERGNSVGSRSAADTDPLNKKEAFNNPGLSRLSNAIIAPQRIRLPARMPILQVASRHLEDDAASSRDGLRDQSKDRACTGEDLALSPGHR